MKKIIICLVSLILLVTGVFSGCGKVETTSEEQQVKSTDIVLFKDHNSDYKVVLPENATEWEEYAAEEFVYFFDETTGFTLPVISDSGITFNENDKYFSIGDTNIYKNSGVEVSFDELGRDGYKVVRKGNTVILKGGGGYGTIYSVYKFLEMNLGYKAYANDEIKIVKTSELNLMDLNVTDKPDFAERAGGYFVTQTDKKFATRMRTLASWGSRLFEKESIWGLWAHTHFSLLPKSEYYEEHRDWYSTDGEQLCLSNMEMRDELTKNLKEVILEREDSELFMIGQEDVATFCNCDECKKVTDKIGNSGLMMQFINDIARRIKEWQKTACPDRIIKIGTFAYQRTQTAPVVVDENGDFVPIDPSVVAEDNVFVLVAPIYADWCSPIYDDEHNGTSHSLLEGWSNCAEHLALWGYCNNFGYNLEYFDNISTISCNYKYYRDLNVFYLFDESGGSVKQGFAFQSMMAYIHSQLMWDCDQNVEDLIDDFMINYYKEAYEPMKKYFTLMRNYVTTRKIELGEKDGKYYGTGIWETDDSITLLNKRFWKSKVILEQMLDYINEATEIVENTKYTKPEKKEDMLMRIKVESLTPRMYLLSLFGSDIDEKLYLDMIEEFELDMTRTGVTSIFTDESTVQTLERWRKSIG